MIFAVHCDIKSSPADTLALYLWFVLENASLNNSQYFSFPNTRGDSSNLVEINKCFSPFAFRRTKETSRHYGKHKTTKSKQTRDNKHVLP